VHAPQGPTRSSQYEHSSLPATIKKIFNLGDDFLTNRDAWAGTFEHILTQRDSPRTDCPEVIPQSPWSLRHSPADEDAPLTQFQEELVQLASQLNGDHRLLDYQHLGKSMTVGQAHAYVTSAMSRFLEAGRMAARAGQDLESLVEVKPSLVGRRAGTFNSKYYDSS
jgi:phospholipase C